MNELQDNELLEFLMTSEFNEELKPEEFKYLLHKFRYFYRILHGKNSNILGQKDMEISSLKSQIEVLNKNYQNLQIEKTEVQNKLDLQPSTLKLTWSERFIGKVNLKNKIEK